jgi:hypothetical protein
MRATRLFLIFALVLGGTVAQARVVLPPEPSVSSVCRIFKSWDAAQKCIRRFGSIHELQTMQGVRVIEVLESGKSSTGKYVFTQSPDQRWALSGELPYNAQVVALGLIAASVSRRIRLDYIQDYESSMIFADQSFTRSHMLVHESMFCPFNAGDGCIAVITRCEERVRGKTVHLFVGTLSVEGKSVVVRGDGSKAGACEGAAQSVAL